MSWDVLLFNTRGRTAPPIEQFEESDYEPLGPAIETRQRLSELLPGIDWSNPTWGVYAVSDFSIEFNVGDEDPIGTMMLHVRGGGDAIAAIAKFSRPMGWSALDCSTSQFLDFDNPSQKGWEGFQAFRDKMIERYRNGDEA